MALLRLNDQGRLYLNKAGQDQVPVNSLVRNVLLLIDTSGSMAGDKTLQAQMGAIDFFHSAITRGYATGLAVFGDRAAMVCDPTIQSAAFQREVESIRVGRVGGGTNLAAGLDLAAKLKSLAAVVVVTDGQPNSAENALRSAAVLKRAGVEILCIGTDDAEEAFLDKLATRKELAQHVASTNMASSIAHSAQLLLGAS